MDSYLTLPLFLVGHDVGYYGPPFFPVGSNFCASVYVHSCISGDVSQPSASLPSSTAFAIYNYIISLCASTVEMAATKTAIAMTKNHSFPQLVENQICIISTSGRN